MADETRKWFTSEVETFAGTNFREFWQGRES